MKAKKSGKGKARGARKPGHRPLKVAINESPIRTPKKTTWEEVVEEEELAETKRGD
jgi:hypothetical protein